MAGRTPGQKKIIVIIDEDEPKKVDRPGPQHETINSSSEVEIAQNAAIPDGTTRPCSRTGQPSKSNNPRPHQPPFHNLHTRISSAVTTSGLRFQPSITTSTTHELSSRRFAGLSSQSIAPSMEPLPRFNIKTVRSKSTRNSDYLERQAKRPKLVSSGTEVVNLDPIRRTMRAIDLENEVISKDRAAKPFKPGTHHYEELQPDMIIQEPHQPDPGSNAPGGFLAGDYMTEEQLTTWLLQSRGNDAPIPRVRTPHLPTSIRPRSAKRQVRNGPIQGPLVLLESYNHSGINLRPNVNVELQSGDFMRIVHLVRDDSTSAVSLRGLMFQRTREMNGVLKKALNEVCWVMHVDEDDGREPSVQAMGEVLVDHVVKRRAIKMTNQPFPALSFRTDLMNETEETVSKNRVLVCRCKYVCYYENAEARDRNAYSEKVIDRIRMGESDINCAVDDKQLHHEWRGDSIQEGASSKDTESVRFVSAGLIDSRDSQNRHSQRDSKGRFSPVRHGETSKSTPAQHKEPIKNSRHRQMHPQAQVPCDVFNSIISVADYADPDDGMNYRTAPDSHAMQLQRSRNGLQVQAHQNSPEVIEVEGYIKATSKKGVVEQAYEGKITSWHSHAAPGRWPKKQRVDSQAATRSTELFNGGATSHSESEQQHRSRESSLDSDQTFRGRSSSVEFLEKTVKHVVPSCPDFQSPQRTTSRAVSAVIPTDRHASSTGIATHRYTYGDAFCGAGGMSRGALMAGLKVKWGFDFDEWACKSYNLNFPFPNTSVYHLRADQFSSLQSEDHQVDIFHLSPPCQFFSPAHTINGKDDDKNIASLFAVFEQLKKTRPRVVTLEQTSGIKTLHPHYLNALILMFTEHGFSIRYKICHLQDYGLAQTRSRLIIIASCPGEALPGFPKPTHSSNPQQTGLKSLATINEALSNIPPDAADHDLSAVMYELGGPPYNGNKQMNCITTSGAGAYHPSGRKLTHRELALLNGFPLEHRFCGTATKKQIGNAVPPMVGKIILEAIRKALEKADGL